MVLSMAATLVDSRRALASPKLLGRVQAIAKQVGTAVRSAARAR